MGKRIVFIISTLLAILSIGNACAANSTLFTAGRQGLSSTYVNHVLQDSRGFVWIATRGGLDRYDGVRFVSWHKGALPSDNVTCIAEDGDGRLVAGTVRGAAVYDYKSGSFTPVVTIIGTDTLNVHVTSLLRLAGGDMLITTTGRGFSVSLAARSQRSILMWLSMALARCATPLWLPMARCGWLAARACLRSTATIV